ncbi:hypothetical protein O6P43_005682 [Quillaja saponaria]|uniref:Uncharacterized protein n=1 Tax=Quillaja saponaria TaxID=32244 RepID=A0AAD7VHB2_QUISA|nr:hypothetical protein O6P43_005682 [Quillaja saponaria]
MISNTGSSSHYKILEQSRVSSGARLISIPFIQSSANFKHLTGNHSRDVEEFDDHFVPKLPPVTCTIGDTRVSQYSRLKLLSSLITASA